MYIDSELPMMTKGEPDFRDGEIHSSEAELCLDFRLEIASCMGGRQRQKYRHNKWFVIKRNGLIVS